MESHAVPDGPLTAEALATLLRGAGLVSGDARLTPLAGGVSSDIWRVDADGEVFVVKRALAKLKVAADWRAPVSRNISEVAWFNVVNDIAPHCVPKVLYHDADAGLFAMTYFAPDAYPVWKSQLMRGQADVGFSALVGQAMALIHAATLDNVDLARQFDNDETFHAIRLEPYLEEAARRHPAVAHRLMALSRRTGACHIALVHGDMSPKNVLAGPEGPIFLDAECAWYGDPAFDLAFCLNHLLLKCAYAPFATADFIASFDALNGAYSRELGGEVGAAVLQRTTELLPALLLARIDGKSPVEYLPTEAQRDTVRRFALGLLVTPVRDLGEIRDQWSRALASSMARQA